MEKVKQQLPLQAQTPDLLIQLTQHSENIFFIYDLQARQFTQLNLAFEKVWGVSRERVYQDDTLPFQLVHPDDQQYLLNNFLFLQKGAASISIEFRIVLPKPEEKWIRLTGHAIRNKAGQTEAISGFAEDITKMRRYLQTLERFNSKKNSTLEILAHDLSGPLNIIQNMASLVAKQTEQYDDEDTNQYIRMIQNTCQRSVSLIQDLIHQEFLESAAIELKKKRVNIVAKVEDLVSTYIQSQEYIAKNFAVMAPQMQVYIEVDELKFMQVLNNLISNAIKFTPEGGNISIRIKSLETITEIAVEDNGIGIPKELQPYLFDKFTRARRRGLRGEPTVGLGMSLIKTIVELHGGKITFQSQEHKGTTFRVRLPK